MIRLTCRLCRGTGTVPNPVYEACRTIRSPEARRHFYFDYDGEPDQPEEGSDGCAVHDRKVSCPQCLGHGVVEFDEEEWELSVIPEEDEEE